MHMEPMHIIISVIVIVKNFFITVYCSPLACFHGQSIAQKALLVKGFFEKIRLLRKNRQNNGFTVDFCREIW